MTAREAKSSSKRARPARSSSPSSPSPQKPSTSTTPPKSALPPMDPAPQTSPTSSASASASSSPQPTSTPPQSTTSPNEPNSKQKKPTAPPTTTLQPDFYTELPSVEQREARRRGLTLLAETTQRKLEKIIGRKLTDLEVQELMFLAAGASAFGYFDGSRDRTEWIEWLREHRPDAVKAAESFR